MAAVASLSPELGRFCGKYCRRSGSDYLAFCLLFLFSPSLSLTMLPSHAVQLEERKARQGREGEPAMGTRHADRYSGARDAPPRLLPPPQAGWPRGRRRRLVNQSSEEGSDPAAVGRSVLSPGCLLTSARGIFQGKHASSFNFP